MLATTWPSAVVAVVAWVSIVVAIDPAGSYPNMPEGPGLTVDEIFNVEQGVLLVEQARSLGWLNLVPGTSVEAFKPENQYLPDHPPLGRYWLGVHHQLTWWLAPPFEPEGPFVTACARTGSATAFALTVWMIGIAATSWFGRTTGLFASLALVLMPRVYGHAHLASLETITNLTCTAAVLAVAAWWNGAAPPSRRVALLTGVVMGLALLTKIQAVLIPIPVILWALWRWRAKAIMPLLIWGVTANVVFFALWPYLWLDPAGHFLEYLGRTTNRATIHCYYFGVRYDDKAVPWHYPFVMFAVTVPVGLHVLGLFGLRSASTRQRSPLFPNAGSRSFHLFHRDASTLPPSPRRGGSGRGADEGTTKDSEADATASLSPSGSATVAPLPNPPRRGEGTREEPTLTNGTQNGNDAMRSHDVLLLACMVFPLIVFALPGVAVYDGERLFLTVFPLWAIFVGRGVHGLWCLVARWADNRITASVASVVFVIVEASSLVTMYPCHLAYYSGFSQFFPPAEEHWQQEVDYWGVGVTRELLQQLARQVPPGSIVATAPTLHQFQADEYRRQSPILRRHGIKTIAYKPATSPPKYVLVFGRRADLPPSFGNLRPLGTELASTRFRFHRLAVVARRDWPPVGSNQNEAPSP